MKCHECIVEVKNNIPCIIISQKSNKNIKVRRSCSDLLVGGFVLAATDRLNESRNVLDGIEKGVASIKEIKLSNGVR